MVIIKVNTVSIAIFLVFTRPSNKILNVRFFDTVYVDFGEGKDTITLSVDTNAAEKTPRMWNMEIKQIPCESTLLGKF